MFASTKSASPIRRIAQTFTSNTAWVAPVNVSNLLVLTGDGQDGTAAYWSTLNNIGAIVNSLTSCFNTSYGPSLDYSVPYGQAQAVQTITSGWTTSSSGQFASFTRTYIYDWCPAASEWQVSSVAFAGTVRRTGTVNLVGNMPSSGTVPTPPASQQTATCSNLEFYTAATNGDPTTGFGYTFAGGSGGPATPVTYNNVSITPGATYNLVVPAGGSISIEYYG